MGCGWWGAVAMLYVCSKVVCFLVSRLVVRLGCWVSLGAMRSWWLLPGGLRVVGVEEAGSTGLLGLGACGLGELAAACHRLAPWATWGESLAAACLTGCGELSAHPGQWGPGGQVSPVAGFEERRFNTTCLLSASIPPACSRPAWGSPGLGPDRPSITAAPS